MRRSRIINVNTLDSFNIRQKFLQKMILADLILIMDSHYTEDLNDLYLKYNLLPLDLHGISNICTKFIMRISCWFTL